MREEMTFTNRLGNLVASGGLLLIFGLMVACLWTVRNMIPGTVLDKEMVDKLTLIRVFSVPAIAAFGVAGVYEFYQALKE